MILIVLFLPCDRKMATLGKGEIVFIVCFGQWSVQQFILGATKRHYFGCYRTVTFWALWSRNQPEFGAIKIRLEPPRDAESTTLSLKTISIMKSSITATLRHAGFHLFYIECFLRLF